MQPGFTHQSTYCLNTATWLYSPKYLLPEHCNLALPTKVQPEHCNLALPTKVQPEHCNLALPTKVQTEQCTTSYDRDEYNWPLHINTNNKQLSKFCIESAHKGATQMCIAL